jgi:thiol-disulfide isomerase/thioredoxin
MKKFLLWLSLAILGILAYTFLASFFRVGNVPMVSAQEKAIELTAENPTAEVITNVQEEPVHLYLFYGDGCPHCEKEREFLQELQAEYGDQIVIEEFEVYYHPKNSYLMKTLGQTLNLDTSGVPMLFVEDEIVVGFSSAETTGSEIRGAIKSCQQSNCHSEVDEIVIASGITGQIIKALPLSPAEEEGEVAGITQDQTQLKQQDFTIKVPLVGPVDLKRLSLPALTILLGFLDGFNPCAMWILIFLITMLINLEDRKRLFLLGFTFIFVSALVYFGFLAAWFNLFQFIGYVYWIRLLVGLVAIGSGIMHLKNYYEEETGCHVTNTKQRLKIMTKIKSVIARQSLAFALVGISALAVSVNLIELICSAGLPAIYTNILASADLPRLQYYLLLVLYAVIFMIDDLVVFTVAVKTFHLTGITNKYMKFSNLIGGILILIIGILLLFRPQALMFG